MLRLHDERYDDRSDEVEMVVNDDDLVELCKMGLVGVKGTIRPDTDRVAEAFDDLMIAVKRRCHDRHQDPKTAIERCFAGFAGRGKTKVGVRQFAETLSVLSIQWSDNFSRETCLALAEDLCRNGDDTPGMITIDSFREAVQYGVLRSQSSNPARPAKSATTAINRRIQDDEGDDDSFAGSQSAQLEPVNSQSEDERSLGEGPGTTDGTDAPRHTGEVAFNCGASSRVVLVLKTAASEARQNGVDVWSLLHDLTHTSNTTAIFNSIAETMRRRRSNTNGDETAAVSPVTRQAMVRFLTKLGVEVRARPPSPSTGSFSRNKSNTVATGGDDIFIQKGDRPQNYSAKSPWLSEMAERRARTRIPGLESEVCVEMERGRSSTPSPRLAVRGHRGSSASPAPDRYIRQLSEDTASVRCRLKVLTRELNRTRGEAEALLSHKPQQELATPSEANSEEKFELETTADQRTSFGAIAKAWRQVGAGGAYGVLEIPDGGSMFGWGGVGVEDREGLLHRMTPLEHRTDRSHPRVDMIVGSRGNRDTARKNSSSRDDASSTRFNPNSPPVWAARATPNRHFAWKRKSTDTIDKAGETPANFTTANKLQSSNASEKGATDISRTSKILGPSRHSNKALTGVAPGTQSAPEKKSPSTSTSIEDDNGPLFDPPSVRNGLRGLSMQEVDRLLLGVETAASGSKSVWKNPGNLEWSRVFGDSTGRSSECSTLFSVSWATARRGVEGDRAMEDVSIQKMRKVIRAPRSAMGPPLHKRNRWDTDKLKWVGPLETTTASSGASCWSEGLRDTDPCAGRRKTATVESKSASKRSHLPERSVPSTWQF